MCSVDSDINTFIVVFLVLKVDIFRGLLIVVILYSYFCLACLSVLILYICITVKCTKKQTNYGHIMFQMIHSLSE